MTPSGTTAPVDDRATDPEVPPSAPGAGGPERRGPRPWLLVLLLLAFAAALVPGVVAMADEPWHPGADLAETEMKVRDVVRGDPPLVGLGGRIGDLGPDRGSHPGPVSFYVLAPVYLLFGAAPTGLLVGTVVSHLAAVGCALWLVGRRGGTGAVVGAAAALAALVATYGPVVTTFPWNPYLPVLWWVALLVAAWSVACDDWPALPVAVFAASFCVQTHVPYAPVVGAVAATTVALVVLDRIGRRHPGTTAAPAARGASSRRRWLTSGALLGVALWTPPVIDQLTASDGNLSRLYRHFSAPSEAVQGFGEGGRQLLALSNPWRLVTGDVPVEGFIPADALVPGAVLLALWAALAVAAGRRGHADLVRLHVLLGGALAGAWVALSRIFGMASHYLALWAWGITTVVVVAAVWTAVVVLAPRLARLPPAAVPAALVVLAILGVARLADLATAPTPRVIVDQRGSRLVGGLAPPTIERLAAGDLPGTGEDGRYVVTASDPEGVGVPFLGLVNELDRQGIDVGVDPYHRAAVSSHRVLDPSDATARLHLASGADVAVWRSDPAAVEVASMRGTIVPDDREALADLRASAVEALRAAGRPELVVLVEDDPAALAADEDLPLAIRMVAGGAAQIEASVQPAAVFVTTPDADEGPPVG